MLDAIWIDFIRFNKFIHGPLKPQLAIKPNYVEPKWSILVLLLEKGTKEFLLLDGNKCIVLGAVEILPYNNW